MHNISHCKFNNNPFYYVVFIIILSKLTYLVPIIKFKGNNFEVNTNIYNSCIMLSIAYFKLNRMLYDIHRMEDSDQMILIFKINS